MIRVKVIGAGSIGNHLAHACRQQGWAVAVVDTDPAALRRTRDEIYPQRYGHWDPVIRLQAPADCADEAFDLVIIGTPPDTHLALALAELEHRPPTVMLIEKPLAPPLADCMPLLERARATGTRVLVGYNHRLTAHSVQAAEWLAARPLGEASTLRVRFREHWGGIFAAHPWLSGPADSYLGFTSRGGGALCEHSHGVNIFQYFSGLAGQGQVVEVDAMLDEVRRDGAEYDRLAQLSLRTAGGLVGLVVQDVVTLPAEKALRLEGEHGHLEWQVNSGPGEDRLSMQLHAQPESSREQLFPKSRPDDFLGEIAHIGKLLANPGLASPIDLETGIATMRIIDAALRSSREGRRIRVDYTGLAPPAAKPGVAL